MTDKVNPNPAGFRTRNWFMNLSRVQEVFLLNEETASDDYGVSPGQVAIKVCYIGDHPSDVEAREPYVVQRETYDELLNALETYWSAA